TVKNTAFLVLLIIAGLFCMLAMILEGTQFQGNETYRIFPVTYALIDIIRGSLNFFIIVVIIYFSGVLFLKDRDEGMDSITNATPTPDWISYAARLLTLIAIVTLIQTIGIVMAVTVQSVHGYDRFQFGVYFHELLVRDASGFLFLAILA